MPYKSDKQRRFMHARHPQIAARWDQEYGGKVRKSEGYGSVATGRRITELDEFGKGVMPVLARRAPAAGRGGRRIVTGDAVNARRVIGKAYAMNPAALRQLKGLSAQADQAAFRSAKPKPVATKKPRYVINSPGFETRIGKADGNKWVYEDVSKAPSFGGLKTGAKNLYGVMRGGFRSGLAQSRGVTGAAAKPKMGMGASVAAAKSPALQRAGSFAQSAGRNPLATGAVAGAGLGAGGASMMGGGNRRQSMYVPPQPMYAGFGKRTADPEDDRRFRQGAYAAGTGIGGAALTASGVRGVRRDSRSLSRIKADADLLDTPRVQDPPRRAQQRRHPKGAVDPATGKPLRGFRPFTPQEVDAENRRVNRINQARAHQQKQLDAVGRLRQGAKGKIVSGRSAGKLGGGVALLGTSGALLRRRHEDRWD